MDLWRGAFSDTVEEDRPNEEGMGDLEELRIIFFVYCIMPGTSESLFGQGRLRSHVEGSEAKRAPESSIFPNVSGAIARAAAAAKQKLKLTRAPPPPPAAAKAADDDPDGGVVGEHGAAQATSKTFGVGRGGHRRTKRRGRKKRRRRRTKRRKRRRTKRKKRRRRRRTRRRR